MAVSRKGPKKRFYLYDNVARKFIEIQDGFVCGRSEGDLQFQDDNVVSRKQCQFFVQGNDVYIEDLGSTNRTRVNSVPAEPGHRRRIQLYDVIEFGAQRLTLSHQAKFPPNVQDRAAHNSKLYKAARGQDGKLTSDLSKKEDISTRTLIMLDRATFRRLRLEETFGSRREKRGRGRRTTGRPAASRASRISSGALLGWMVVCWLGPLLGLGYVGALDRELPFEASEVILGLSVMSAVAGAIAWGCHIRWLRDRIRNPSALAGTTVALALFVVMTSGLLALKSGILSRTAQNLAVARCIRAWDGRLCRQLARWDRDQWLHFSEDLRAKLDAKVRQ